MSHLICYDISSNTLRAKIGRKILEFGLDRINKSVYLGTINDSGLAQLESWIATTLAAKGEPDDSLIVLPVNPDQIQRLRVYGNNELDKDELSGGKSTLIL